MATWTIPVAVIDASITVGSTRLTPGPYLVANANRVILPPAGLSAAEIPVANAIAAIAVYTRN